MAEDRIDPNDPIPEVDRLEQAPLDPQPLSDDEQKQPVAEPPAASADEAGRWEQQMSVPAVDDDYPHARDAAGWS